MDALTQQQSSPAQLILLARKSPHELRPTDARYLQRTIGNQAVGRLLASNSSLQRKPAPVAQRTDDEENDQSEEGPVVTVQRAVDDQMVLERPSVEPDAAASAPVSSHVEGDIKQALGAGQGLAAAVRTPLERAFSRDFGAVKIHTDARSDRLNRSLQARAFTTGQDIFFRQGEFQPENQAGRRLIAHELAHVVQQGGAGGPAVPQEATVNEAAPSTESVPSLQTKPWSNGVHGWVQRSRAPVSISTLHSGQPSSVVTVQRVRLSKDDLLDKSLSGFDEHRKAEQFDWANAAGLTKADSNSIWWLLEKAVGACGKMKVKDLVTATQDPTGFRQLQIYMKAVNEPFLANKSKLRPADTTAEALKQGKWLETFSSALKTLPPEEFLELIRDEAVAEKFKNYLADVNPSLESENGAESRAFREFVAEGGDYLKYKAELPEIRNLHKFTNPALKKLSDDKKDTSKTKPLTLILHSMHDDNGAFHRHSGIDDAIRHTDLLVLLYEKIDAPTLAAFPKSEFKRIAETYGKGNKITQVMIAGHGSPKHIAMGIGGSVKELTGDDKKLNTLPLYMERELVQGVEKLADWWDTFFSEMYKHMGATTTAARTFEPRVMLRACLTNANSVEYKEIVERLKKNHGIEYDKTVDVTKSEIQEKVQQEVVAYINERGSLTTRLYNKSPKGSFKVIGASASISSASVGTVYPTGELGFPSKSDPAVDKDKIEYVKSGQEAEGAMRAMVECWAVNKKQCQEAMEERVKTAANKLDPYIINLLYSLILAKYKDNLLAANKFVDTAGKLSHLGIPVHCRLEKLTGDNMLKENCATIVDGLLKFKPVKDTPYMVIVLTQYHMLQDASKQENFLAALSDPAVSMDDDKYVDIEKIGAVMEALLNAKMHERGRNLLALFGVIAEKVHPKAKQYLLQLAKSNADNLPKEVIDLLNGSAYSEDDIRKKLGLPPRKAAASVKTAVIGGKKIEPNVDTNNDNKNDAYVAPLTPVLKKVTNMVFDARIRSAPNSSAPVLYKEPESALVLGEVRTLDDKPTNFYAVKNKQTSGVAYTEKDNFGD
jgi:hypothetical protein